MKKLKVLEGSASCRNCEELIKRLKEAATAIGLEYELERVTDLREIMAYGVMMTPGLVVDGEVKLMGRVPKVEELKKLLQ